MGAPKLQLDTFDAEYVRTHTKDEVLALKAQWEQQWPELRPIFEEFKRVFGPDVKMIRIQSVPTKT